MTGLWARRPDPFCLERLHDSDDAACPKQGIEAPRAGAGEGPLALHRVCVCGVARASNEAPLLPLPLTVGSGPSSPMMFLSSELYLHNRPALGFSSHPESNLSPRDDGGPGAWVPASPLSPAASYRPRILRLPRRGFCCRHVLSLEFISPDMSELRPHDAFHCSPSPSPTNQQTAGGGANDRNGNENSLSCRPRRCSRWPPHPALWEEARCRPCKFKPYSRTRVLHPHTYPPAESHGKTSFRGPDRFCWHSSAKLFPIKPFFDVTFGENAVCERYFQDSHVPLRVCPNPQKVPH